MDVGECINSIENKKERVKMTTTVGIAEILIFMIASMFGGFGFYWVWSLPIKNKGEKRTRARHPSRQKRLHITDDVVVEMRRLRKTGMTNPDIANAVGASNSSVTKYIGKQPTQEVRVNLEQMTLDKSTPEPQPT